ncbi:MAG: class I SAM-dependent methyltransferase [Bdellovibrio sp.]|nr:class I SAM-dependent methyltransferase [Bdellovibrio sp.]
MASEKRMIAPEHTAVRVALWRALHVRIDPKPHVFTDEIGLKLVGEDDWQSRPDMNPEFSKSMRASIVGRARFIEDLVEEQIKQGVTQYVILGAGLDTFAQRRPDMGSGLQIFEVDQPGPQAWKQKRLHEVGLSAPSWLHFVPVDFEAGQSWWEQLIAAGFDNAKPAVIVSTGVSMYLTKEANLSLLQQMTKLAPGSTFAMTFMLSLDLLESAERASMEFVMKRAQEAGTPFLSLFSPGEMLALANEAGIKTSQYVSANDLYQRYFAQRTDGLNAGTAEAFLVVRT